MPTIAPASGCGQGPMARTPGDLGPAHRHGRPSPRAVAAGCSRLIRTVSPEAASWTSRSGTPASSAAVMNACLSVWGVTALAIPARRDRPCGRSSAVPVHPPPVRGQEDRPAGAFADGQVDRPGSARRQRDGDYLAALIRVIVRVRCPRSRPRYHLGARQAPAAAQPPVTVRRAPQAPGLARTHRKIKSFSPNGPAACPGPARRSRRERRLPVITVPRWHSQGQAPPDRDQESDRLKSRGRSGHQEVNELRAARRGGGGCEGYRRWPVPAGQNSCSSSTSSMRR